MSANPRTPRYFPAMKVRGARRNRLAPFQRLAGSFDRMSDAAKRVGESMRELAKVGGQS